MAFAFKTSFVWYWLCLVVCISGNTVTASFEIQRGKIDTFTNLECQKPHNCTDEQCEKYGAKCVDDKCERCQCKVGNATFLANTTATGNCTKDENIIPESVPKQTFRLKKLTKNATLTNQCLTVADEQNYNISGGNCSSSLNMHWIWTKKRIENQDKFYLMNVMTLQCLEFLTSTLVCASNDKYQIGEVALKQCNKIDGQYILVNSNIIKSELCSVRRNYYIRLENVQNDVGYPAFSQRNIVDRWTNNEDHLNLHKRPTKYTGCYRFQKERFMVYLDNETCRENPCSHQFSAPIFYENTNCKVKWSKSRIVYSDNVQWQNVTEISTKLVSIESGPGNSSNIKMLKVYQEALTKFNGSLVRLAISCADEMSPKLVEEHCLLLKFKSLLRNEEMMTTSSTMTTSSEMTTSSKMATSSTLTISPKMMNSPTVKLENKDTEENSNIIAIAVPVFLLAVILVLTLVCFVCYRKRKGRLKLSNDQDQNQPPTLKESTLPLNPLQPSNTNQSTQRISQHYEVPCERQYEYVDKTAIAPPKTFTYDYAFVDGPLKNNHGTRVGLNRTGEDDYVIKNDAKMTQETHDDYVVRDESYVSVIEPRPETKDEGMHDDYVVRDESYVSVIEPRPETKDEETHDDYVVRDESYVSVIEPRSRNKR